MRRDLPPTMPVPTPPAFQSTRPHEARHRSGGITLEDYQFQSTRPHEARHALMSFDRMAIWFQSTRPHEARRTRRRGCSVVRCFNPRARMRRDRRR
ncbi:hypothetical protein OF001_U180116 [Pseudomonas sp. OF001]|nr:hypothetical protein OF001_U180116 [Pseudomonas sp. OF001]